MSHLGAVVLLFWLAAVAAAFWAYRRELAALWNEPVLRHPVLIIESDDWGAGPVDPQVSALQRLARILVAYRDSSGRPPVMTLAVVLAVPDGAAIRRDGTYRRQSLDAPLFAPLREVLRDGRRSGVFALQLHGLEHYWPDALMRCDDPAVAAWLHAEAPPATERLPAPLQSRWVDASTLPSRPLETATIEAAVREEVLLFETVFSERPRVAVPPTFVWTEDVERAWARQGIDYVVTPGLRSACRDATGCPACDSGPLLNGQCGAGVTYLVRDDYFEPERGHHAQHALAALASKICQGRPCLLETHRSNFIGDASVANDALRELDRLCAAALQAYPRLRFLTTAELGDALRCRSPEWVEARLARRICAWCARTVRLAGFSRWAKITGIYWLLKLPQITQRARR